MTKRKDKNENYLKLIIGLLVSFFFIGIVIKKLLSKSSHKVQVKDAVSENSSKIAQRVRRNIKLHIESENQTKAKKSAPKKTQKKLSERESKIMNLFDDKDEISMEDIHEVLTGVNVRTIRRDLHKLSDKNLIKKQGKTKGSKYILA